MSSVHSSNRLPFQAVQAALSAHIRDPEFNPGPDGIEARRLAIYKRLFYNNIEAFCSKTFKAFRAVVDDEYWHSLIRDFMREHQCTTPFFREIPNEFLQFLVEHQKQDEKYPYIVELCHYDSVRIELYFATDSVNRDSGHLTNLDQEVAISPLVRLLSYQWPVHRIDKDFSLESLPPEHPTWIIAYRNKQDEVEFLVSNPRTLRMLELLRTACTGNELVDSLGAELEVDQGTLRDSVLTALQAFVAGGVVELALDPASVTSNPD